MSIIAVDSIPTDDLCFFSGCLSICTVLRIACFFVVGLVLTVAAEAAVAVVAICVVVVVVAVAIGIVFVAVVFVVVFILVD